MSAFAKKPVPPKRFKFRRHIMLSEDHVEYLEKEARRQSAKYEDPTTVSDVIRQCIEHWMNVEDIP